MNIINFNSSAIPVNPPAPTDHNSVAYMEVDSGQAAAPSEKQKKNSPLQETVEALFKSATNARSEKKLDQAVKDLTSCLNLNPEMTSAREMRAFIFREQNKYQEALDDLNKIFEHPAQVSQKMRIARADLFTQLGKLSEAIGEYSTILISYNENAGIYYQRALVLKRKERYREALQDLNKILQSGRKEALVYKHCAECYFKLGIWDKAIQDFTEYLNIVPSDVEARLHRGKSSNKIKKYEDAIADFSIIIQTAEKSPAALEALQLRSTSFCGLKKWKEAESDLDAYLKEKPEDDFHRLLKLDLLWESGQKDRYIAESEEWFKKMPLSFQSFEALYSYYTMFSRLGQEKKASPYFYAMVKAFLYQSQTSLDPAYIESLQPHDIYKICKKLFQMLMKDFNISPQDIMNPPKDTMNHCNIS